MKRIRLNVYCVVRVKELQMCADISCKHKRKPCYDRASVRVWWRKGKMLESLCWIFTYECDFGRMCAWLCVYFNNIHFSMSLAVGILGIWKSKPIWCCLKMWNITISGFVSLSESTFGYYKWVEIKNFLIWVKTENIK